MQINPGGRLNTRDVVGRDNEIARYWRVLERQGLVISAERRIGKTHIVLKMRDECRSGFLPFYQDLESVHSTAELIRSIYATVHQSLSTLSGLRAHVAKWSSLLPDRIGSVALPAGAGSWQVLLSRAFDDLIGIADDGLILMLWDEFPLMLHNLQRREGDDAAIQILDFLRALRLARADRLRFLFTGSIGLHLVLRSLRKAGNTNDPVNDMLSLTVPPMAQEDTCGLAAALLEETRAAPAHIPGPGVANRRRGRRFSVLHPPRGRPARPTAAPARARGRIVGRGHSCLRPPRPGEPQLLHDPPVFVLRRRRAVAGLGGARHHGGPSVADTRPGTPQSVQAP